MLTGKKGKRGDEWMKEMRRGEERKKEDMLEENRGKKIVGERHFTVLA